MALPTLARIVKPSKATLLFLALYALSYRFQLSAPRSLKALITAILLLNWSGLPGMWHFRSMFRTMLLARKEQLLAYTGLHSGRGGGRGRELGLAKKWWHLKAVGRSPWAAVQHDEFKCRWADSDCYLHQSNSVYPAKMDANRGAYAMNLLGPVIVYEGLQIPLGGVSTIFLREISMFETYTVETRLVGWTDRWSFVLTIFTIAPPKRPSSRDLIIETSRGKRQLCCLGLSKNCFKSAGQSGLLRPSRVLSAAGFGPDAANWVAIDALRQQGGGASKRWLAEAEGPDGMEQYAPANQRALEVIGRLAGGEKKEVWLELLGLHQEKEGAEKP